MEQLFEKQQAIAQDVLIERVNNLIKENSDAHNQIKEDQTRILIQTTKTNGTVLDLLKWKERATGGFIIINVVIIPVLIWLVCELLSTKL